MQNRAPSTGAADDPQADGRALDPGALDDARLDHFEPLAPRRLYLFAEQQQWMVGPIDVGRDRADWAALTDGERTMLLKSLAPFYAGEERVAAVLAPIILAADDEQELAFLASQQLDEARHMQLFERMWREVFAGDRAASRTALDDARARCNPAFGELFDRRLAGALARLRMNPHDVEAKVEAVAIYHLVVEGTMGLTGMHFLLDYFQKRSLLPAFTDALRKVKQDEHRHVAWGTWYLRNKCREQQHYGFIVSSTLMELLPLAASVLMDSGQGVCDGLDPVEFLDYPSVAVNHFALVGLGRRLKVVGGATEEIQRFVASGAWRAARLL
jgi:ribonucleoside-diphosphate reductase beta chain